MEKTNKLSEPDSLTKMFYSITVFGVFSLCFFVFPSDLYTSNTSVFMS